jgi:hypothetical protein
MTLRLLVDMNLSPSWVEVLRNGAERNPSRIPQATFRLPSFFQMAEKVCSMEKF